MLFDKAFETFKRFLQTEYHAASIAGNNCQPLALALISPFLSFLLLSYLDCSAD